MHLQVYLPLDCGICGSRTPIHKCINVALVGVVQRCVANSRPLRQALCRASLCRASLSPVFVSGAHGSGSTYSHDFVRHLRVTPQWTIDGVNQWRAVLARVATGNGIAGIHKHQEGIASCPLGRGLHGASATLSHGRKGGAGSRRAVIGLLNTDRGSCKSQLPSRRARRGKMVVSLCKLKAFQCATAAPGFDSLALVGQRAYNAWPCSNNMIVPLRPIPVGNHLGYPGRRGGR